MPDVITDVNQMTPELLTEVLQATGTLPQGRVMTIEPQGLFYPTFTSTIVRLEVCYSADAPPSAPSHFLLKMSRPEAHSDVLADLGRPEVAFYTTISPAMSDSPAVDCYHALYIPDTRQFHILLADVSETHEQTEWPLPGTYPTCIQSVECLARFHAYWWDHPHLGTEIISRPSEFALQGPFSDLQERCTAFVNFLGDRLSPERRAVYDRVLAAWPALANRLTTGRDVTIVHGDAHMWNFLYPRGSPTDTACLVDWQLWHISVGASDLAYMMALHWYPDRRAALEQPLLRHYHHCLQEHGLRTYSWEACWRDYQWSAVRNLLLPVIQWAAKIPAAGWWPHLERAMLAFEDLDGDSLLKS
ncbi:MAG: hypothetical protein ETSY1_34780 [Candidatus Entotheonella factor]|uniref:Aminoglycoside phosphotransferase domain-containing protein n=1 Tax=Entotheonella factor TaxID=1429438 RepID=W4L9T4_ENTF1|nr:MAG: hypothetical protein ETSY1_34780 [Candidatus Entotheonella factor]